MVTDNPPDASPEAAESNPISILRFLSENRPDPERAKKPSEYRLIEPLRVRLHNYEDRLKEAGVPDEVVMELASEHASDLETTLQDPRPYIELGNRAYANGRLRDEVLDVILASEQEPTLDDLDRVVRLDLDLDEFKTFNDYYGHKAGDNILHTFSETLKNGEAVSWLREQDVLTARDENQPSAVEFTVEGGEEFGGLIVFKKGTSSTKRQEILAEFTHRLQAEVAAKFKEVIAETTEGGELKFPRLKEPPAGVTLPEGFLMESGVSIGYASIKDIAEKVTIDETGETFETVIGKIRAQLYETSDGHALENKEVRKMARWESNEGSDAKLTAEISPRGRAELLEKEKNDLEARIEELRGEMQALQEKNDELQERLTRCEQGL
ncbi:GGDEF domain-containing protein [Patescibacteria group bacterium]|nr:GGDEF domain-containing protein [Patescibacteria group bacterium]